ncbi:MAG: hypothetical protein ACRC8J_06105, partial [Phocaeicola sp.]
RITVYDGIRFSYSNNKISVNQFTAHKKYPIKDYTASILIANGKVKEIKSTYETQVTEEDSLQLVSKSTNYEYVGDTIFISSYYRFSATNRLFKAVQRKCILDSQKRLAEMITLNEGIASGAKSYSRSFDYRNNINCTANLNLIAYTIGVKDIDEFFFFLLNVGKVFNTTILPNAIVYNINKGEEMYNVAANYYFQEDNLTQVELLKDNKQLILRHEFNYLP